MNELGYMEAAIRKMQISREEIAEIREMIKQQIADIIFENGGDSFDAAEEILVYLDSIGYRTDAEGDI